MAQPGNIKIRGYDNFRFAIVGKPDKVDKQVIAWVGHNRDDPVVNYAQRNCHMLIGKFKLYFIKHILVKFQFAYFPELVAGPYHGTLVIFTGHIAKIERY